MRTCRQRRARKIVDRLSGFVINLRMYRLWIFLKSVRIGIPDGQCGVRGTQRMTLVSGRMPLSVCVPATATKGRAVDDTPGLAASDPSPVVAAVVPFTDVLGGSAKGGAGYGGSSQQRDAGIMFVQSSNYFAVTSLYRMSSEMMSIGMGRVVFPAEEIAALYPVPRAPRGAMYMAAIGLWCPQTGLCDPGPVPASSCNACMNCRYCFLVGRLPPE